MKKFPVEVMLTQEELIALTRFTNLDFAEYQGYHIEFESYKDREIDNKVEKCIVDAFKAVAKAAKKQWDIE